MKNLVEEIQFPVGQGGLHLGVINDFAYIYDCGALDKDNEEWNNHFYEICAILSRAYDVKEIHIYISHMHYDHCNKLFSLIKELRKIDIRSGKIYIPKITSPEKLLLLLDSNISIKQDYGFYQFIRDPIGSFRNSEFQVIELNPSENNEYKPQETKSHLGIFYEHQWILDPFISKANNDKKLLNFSSKVSDPKIKEFLDKLLSNQQDRDIAEKLFDCLENEEFFDKLQTEYRNHFESNKFHESMLCLYSGPQNYHDCYIYNFCIDYNFCQPHCHKLYRFHKQKRYFNHFLGWLHTGDINLKKIEDTPFYKYYKEYLPDKVSIMQIPHHGSKNNHDANFLNIFGNNIKEKLFYLTINNQKRNKPGEAKMDVSDIFGLYLDHLQILTEYPNKGIYFQILLREK